MMGISWIYAKHIPFELSYDGYSPGIYPNYFMDIQHVFKPSREVLGDERMAGHQHFSFEMVVNEESGEREFGALYLWQFAT